MGRSSDIVAESRVGVGCVQRRWEVTSVFEVEGHQEEPGPGSWDCCSGLTSGRRRVAQELPCAAVAA